MQENLKYILEVFKKWDTKKRLIYIDVINDLIETHKHTSWEKKIDLENIEIDENTILLQDTIGKLAQDFQASWMTQEELMKKNETLKQTLDLGYDSFDGDIWFIAFNKLEEMFLRTHTGVNVLEQYNAITLNTISSINQSRRIFLVNLDKKWVITRIHPKNEKLDTLLSEVKGLVMDEWGKNIKPLEDIEDEYLKEKLMEQYENFWQENIDEPVKQFLNLFDSVRHYSFDVKNLEYLYEEMTWEKVERKWTELKHISDKEIMISYRWKNISFEEWAKPYIIISWLYHSDYNWEIELWDIFPKIYSEEYFYSEHEKEKRQISNTISGINKRFRGISDWKNLLQFKDNKITKLI